MAVVEKASTNRILIAAGALLILVLLGFILHVLAGILQPLFIALVLCYLIRPATRFMINNKVPEVLALPAVFTVVLSLTVLFAWFIQGNVEGFMTKTGEFQDRINAKIRGVIELAERGQGLAQRWGLTSKPVSPQLTRKLEDLEEQIVAGGEDGQPLTAHQAARLQALHEDIEELRAGHEFGPNLDDKLTALLSPVGELGEGDEVAPALASRFEEVFAAVREFDLHEQERASKELKTKLLRRLQEIFDLEAATNFAVRGAGTVVGWMGTTILVLVYLMFLLAEAARFPRRIQRSYPPEQAAAILDVVGHINGGIFQYISVKVFMSTLTAVVSLIIMVSFNVEFYVLWALFLFLFNFVPYIGSFVACTFPIATAWLTFDSPWTVLLLALLLIAVQLVVSQIVEPKIAGRRLGISPVVVLTAVAIWGWLWGVLGMVLAVPVVVAAKIIMANVPSTRPIAALIGDIPDKEK